MAFGTNTYAESKEALAINDYGANSITVYLVPGTFQAPTQDEVTSTEVFIASATGRARHATPVQGLAGSQTGSFGMIISDEENDTDKNAPSLVRALARNSVAATGHSAEAYTNQLTGLGRLQCKLVRTLTDEAGATTVKTYPVQITKVDDAIFDGARGYTVNFLLVGAVTRT